MWECRYSCCVISGLRVVLCIWYRVIGCGCGGCVMWLLLGLNVCWILMGVIVCGLVCALC